MTLPAALLAVAAGGALGAALRFLVTLAAARLLERSGSAPFPLGTVIVNVLGCFLLAWLVAAGERGAVGSGARLFLGTGVLGALTTFSTFGLDTHGLVLEGRGLAAVGYLGGTLILAGVAVMAGLAWGRGG